MVIIFKSFYILEMHTEIIIIKWLDIWDLLQNKVGQGLN